MKFGEMRTVTLKNTLSGETWKTKHIYKYASWHKWHTNNDGDGLWRDDKQILGTCQFSVASCKTEKSATAKIRKYVKSYYMEVE